MPGRVLHVRLAPATPGPTGTQKRMHSAGSVQHAWLLGRGVAAAHSQEYSSLALTQKQMHFASCAWPSRYAGPPEHRPAPVRLVLCSTPHRSPYMPSTGTQKRMHSPALPLSGRAAGAAEQPWPARGDAAGSPSGTQERMHSTPLVRAGEVQHPPAGVAIQCMPCRVGPCAAPTSTQKQMRFAPQEAVRALKGSAASRQTQRTAGTAARCPCRCAGAGR
jgi:hypothetical protein